MAVVSDIRYRVLGSVCTLYAAQIALEGVRCPWLCHVLLRSLYDIPDIIGADFFLPNSVLSFNSQRNDHSPF